VDQGKLVDRLSGRVPVEVAQFGWESTVRRLAALGCDPVVRLDSYGNRFVTDGGNLIVDCAFGANEPGEKLQMLLDATVGVVEHGLFLGLASQVVVGGPGGVLFL